jgi:hypothetical protein
MSSSKNVKLTKRRSASVSAFKNRLRREPTSSATGTSFTNFFTLVIRTETNFTNIFTLVITTGTVFTNIYTLVIATGTSFTNFFYARNGNRDKFYIFYARNYNRAKFRKHFYARNYNKDKISQTVLPS